MSEAINGTYDVAEMIKTMTNEQRWAKVNELALNVPAYHNKQEFVSHGKAVAEIYFEWFPEAEYMMEHSQNFGSIVYIADENGKVSVAYELGAKVISE